MASIHYQGPLAMCREHMVCVMAGSDNPSIVGSSLGTLQNASATIACSSEDWRRPVDGGRLAILSA